MSEGLQFLECCAIKYGDEGLVDNTWIEMSDLKVMEHSSAYRTWVRLEHTAAGK
jgi:hypothetical protein